MLQRPFLGLFGHGILTIAVVFFSCGKARAADELPLFKEIACVLSPWRSRVSAWPGCRNNVATSTTMASSPNSASG
ncbi:hypothetical protein B0H67DRAFT_100383 [Lasiosphaeris hirsuta]|uniref:Uncharacterized protein n=1 Tax=Lasiosphaeris hirsuta TaxID=260670 RepID=A0AA40AY42_9PEZI|nr:hypothetical protein B0H67DRAFT_100383 [Lasiosphaeris hirsuta]